MHQVFTPARSPVDWPLPHFPLLDAAGLARMAGKIASVLHQILVAAMSGRRSVTPATGAAGAGGKVIWAGHASELEGLGYILADRFLDFVHFLLRIKKSSRDGIVNEALTVLLKFGDLIVGERHAHLLLLLQRFTFLHDQLILLFALFAGQESVHLAAQSLEFRLIHDGLAEFPGFLEDSVFGGS